MSAGQVGEGRTTSEKQSDPQGKDLAGPETLKNKKNKRGTRERRRGGDKNTGLMTSIA